MATFNLYPRPKTFFATADAGLPAPPVCLTYGEKAVINLHLLPGAIHEGDGLYLIVDDNFVFYDASPENILHAASVMAMGKCTVTAEQEASSEVSIELETRSEAFRDKVNGRARGTDCKIGLYRLSDDSYELLAIGKALAFAILGDYNSSISPVTTEEYYTKGEIDGMVDAKLDKPAVEGQPGQILGLGQDGSTIWKDEPSFEQEQADWTEDDTTSPAFIKNKPDLSLYAQKSELAAVATTGSYNDLSNTPDLSVYAEKSELAPVATSGDYADLSNKPAIPTKVSDLTNDSDYQTAQDVATTLQSYVPETRTVNGHALSQDVTVTASDLGLATVATTGSYDDLSNKPTLPTQDELVPAATSSDAGKVLTVGATGTPAWEESQGGGGADPLDYLCFTAGQANCTVALNKNNVSMADLDLEYSTDKQTWTQYTWVSGSNTGAVITLANAGDRVWFRGDNATFSTSATNYYKFVFSVANTNIAGVYASGNIMSLLDKTCQSVTIPCDYCFYNLFNNAYALMSAPRMPAVNFNQRQSFYGHMFANCASLASVPDFPVFGGNYAGPSSLYECNYAFSDMFSGCTSLAKMPLLRLSQISIPGGCFARMFYNCTALLDGSRLVTSNPTNNNLGNSCFESMFSGCTSLTRAPELPFGFLGSSCYAYMFRGCTSLATAPSLPGSAIVMRPSCCSHMFEGCTSLKTVPELKMSSSAENCCDTMFGGCTSLTSVPVLPGISMSAECFARMFLGCAGLTKAPSLLTTSTARQCFSVMFSGCSNLRYLKMAAPDVTGSANSMLNSTAAKGVLDCPPDLDTSSFLPSGWTVCHNDYDASLEPASFAIPAASTAQLLLPPTVFSHAPSAATVYTLWHDPDKAVETVRIVVDMTATNQVTFQDENGVAIPSGTWAVGSEVEFTCTYANGGWAVVGDDGSKGASQADVQSMIADALTMH